jgi:methylaspartate ammonia-lyase
MYGNQRHQVLIIETKFREEDDAKKAIEEGLTHDGIQYLGSPSKDGAENKLIRIALSHLLWKMQRTYVRDC